MTVLAERVWIHYNIASRRRATLESGSISAAAIRYRREREGISAKELARRAGLSPSYVSKIERGECQPLGVPVLTATRGEVRIEDLDPERDRLVTYEKRTNKIRRGGNRHCDSSNGYRFTISNRPYSGQLVSIRAGDSRVVVTPDHKVTVRWSPRILDSWAVYLMRRDNRWRVGMTKFRSLDGGRMRDGVRGRLAQEKADAVWLVRLFDTRIDAANFERLMAYQYGIPETTFEVGRNPRWATSLPQEALDEFWGALGQVADLPERAERLMDDYGLNPDWPLWEPEWGTSHHRHHRFGRWTTCASHLLSDFMEVPIDPGAGANPVWLPLSVDREEYEGDIFTIDVPSHNHYVTNGVIVHNCAASLKVFGTLAVTLKMTPLEVWCVVVAEGCSSEGS